jgi:hypothetical protein
MKGNKEKIPEIKIDITDNEINRRLDQLESANVPDDLKEYLVNALRALVELDRIVGLKETTIARLRKIFGKKSERHISSPSGPPPNPQPPKPRPPGHGRNSKDDYLDIPSEFHPVKDLKAGDPCPKDDGGILYDYKPRYHIHITGGVPFTAKKVIHQTLRCGLCGLIIEAKSWATGKPKYDVTVRSMLSILHYGSSFPMYRLEKLQKKFFIPMPRSVQWMLLDELGVILYSIYSTLYTLLSNSRYAIMSDDTKAKIQSHTKKINEQKREKERLEILGINSKKSTERVELCTTGMRAIVDGHEIILFVTGTRNSGENIDGLLKSRTIEGKLVVMGDASSKNNPTDKEKVESANCIVHARRGFVELDKIYRSESEIVLELIKNIYKNEEHVKNHHLGPQERLKYHQEMSTSIMTNLKEWCESSLADKKVEPNSPLGASINYVLNHWEGLTGFLRIEGCPLDTNILEGHLRLIVMNRKNWLHLKTEYGAFINDMHVSLNKTCEANGVNLFDYFNVLQLHEPHVRSSPEQWLPWNYKENLKVSSPP